MEDNDKPASFGEDICSHPNAQRGAESRAPIILTIVLDKEGGQVAEGLESLLDREGTRGQARRAELMAPFGWEPCLTAEGSRTPTRTTRQILP